MPRATATAAAQTAQHVLDSATTLFAAKGFADVSLDDVALDAGVTRGAIYHHYRNKTGLFRAVASRLQTNVADAVVAAAESAGADPAAQLRAGSHAFLDAITAAPAVRVLLVDAPAVVGWEEWRHLDAENSGAHLREALSAAGVAEEILDAMTAQLSGAMNEAALWIALQPQNVSAREQAHTVLDQFLVAVVA
ncbi:TetR/AcrR family transcriptional regulator [Ruania halotolerans]|uniref:TetR/AcrR family transcriptional regulator n=1 Tax=Ruania halotolerans TaxID=2897773 RepID=UPI001E3825DC|nr:TetR/AcrR family transcriptional regulator [Ruania halotolerans]UFU05651.1 TetR family transcriptional regulator [Ruania halotolerans]